MREQIRLGPSEATELEREFFADLGDGTLDSFDLYDAFLIASQIVNPGPFQKYRSDLESIRKEAVEMFQFEAAAPVKADSLLRWLHKNHFKSYYAPSFAYNILAEGEFNCLSSGIVYMLLARDIGLDVKGVLVKDHAYCRLMGPGIGQDIQTTVPYGFSPPKPTLAGIEKLTGYVYDPQAQSIEILNPLPYIGALYANRVSLLEKSSALSAKHIAKYKKGLYFHPSSDFFRGNIKASLGKLALSALQIGDFGKIKLLAGEFSRLEGSDKEFLDQVGSNLKIAIVRYVRLNEISLAERLLQSALEQFPENREWEDYKKILKIRTQPISENNS